MKILIIVRTLTDGGAERVAASWANDFSRIGQTVYVMSDFTNYPVTYPLNKGIIRINSVLKKNRILRETIDPLKKLYYYRKIIKQITPDVIICVMHARSIILKLSTIGLKHKPFLILTEHSPYERPTSDPMKLWTVMRKFWYSRVYDLITVLTEKDAQILKNKGFRNVEVMHNPLFLKPVEKIQTKEKVVLAVGRMSSWHCKGFDLLIRAWNNIYKKYPDWKLKIVGSSSEKSLNLLQNLMEDAHSIDFVEYTSDIKEQYLSASIFVLSSRYEGWGLVLVEAMSQGCAAIACDYKGRQAEIITNEENGLLIMPDSVKEIEKSLLRLISDKELRESIQKKAPCCVEKFSEAKTTESWMHIFEKYKIHVR